jgi:hypothetical protein
MVSLIWERRAIPLYWSLLPKLGSSNFDEQTANLQQVLPLFSQYKVIVLGDREFCSIDLGNWLKEKGVSFCLRLKRNHCIEIEHLVWQRLDELGIVPGTSLYFQGKRVRKTQPATGFDVACKWKRNSGACQVDEAWFILTNLGSLEQRSMLISSGWELKKCSEIVKQEATILKEQASKETDLLT